MTCAIAVLTACGQDSEGTSSVRILLASCQQTCMIYTIAVCTVLEFYSKNKFEKLVHLVGFIVRIQETIGGGGVGVIHFGQLLRLYMLMELTYLFFSLTVYIR